MSKLLITTITPVKIERVGDGCTRSVDRLAIQLRSLRAQRGSFGVAPIICDASSDASIQSQIKAVCAQYDAKYVSINTSLVWNKPFCLNVGITNSSPSSQYIAALDLDIIYRDDTLAACVEQCCSRCVVVARSFYSSCESVKTDFSANSFRGLMRAKPAYSSIACGGIQFFNRRWLFEVKGYDERYNLWGGPDSEIKQRAIQAGLSVRILPFGHLLHLAHPQYHLPGVDASLVAEFRRKNRAAFRAEREAGMTICNGHWADESRIVGPRWVEGKVAVPEWHEIWSNV